MIRKSYTRLVRSLPRIVLLAVFGLPLAGQGQAYYFSTPVSGSLSMSILDLKGPAGSSGGFTLNFDTLTEDVYVDLTNQTIRQAGTVTYTPSSPNILFQEIRSTLPNGPNVTADVSVSLAPSENVLSFDTGPRPWISDWPFGGAAFNGDILDLQQNFIGSYSIQSGGQTYVGSFAYRLSLDLGWAWWPVEIGFGDYPNSISLSRVLPWHLGAYGSTPNVVADVTTSDGFNFQLTPGAYKFLNVRGEMLNWSLESASAFLMPDIGTVAATPAVLWPPDHKMVDVFVDYAPTDNFDSPSNITSKLRVTSNEPINGIADGNTSPDWEIVDSHHLRLRAERLGTGTGRIYTITVTCTDSWGNSSSKDVTVLVPKSRGN